MRLTKLGIRTRFLEHLETMGVGEMLTLLKPESEDELLALMELAKNHERKAVYLVIVHEWMKR